MKTKSSKSIQCIVLFIGICFTVQLTSAQNAPLAPRRMEVYMQIRPGDTTFLSQNQLTFRTDTGAALRFHQLTQLAGVMHIILADSSNIQKINVKLGSTPGDSDIFLKSFQNVQGIFNDGTYISISKRGMNMNIGLGNFTGANTNTFYAEVYFQNASGEPSPVVKFAKK